MAFSAERWMIEEMFYRRHRTPWQHDGMVRSLLYGINGLPLPLSSSMMEVSLLMTDNLLVRALHGKEHFFQAASLPTSHLRPCIPQIHIIPGKVTHFIAQTQSPLCSSFDDEQGCQSVLSHDRGISRTY